MDPEELVDAVYAAAWAGDVEGALALCAPEGEWHPIAGLGDMDHPLWRWGPGSQSLRTYFAEILPVASEFMEGYAVLSVEREVIGDLVVSRLRSTHGYGVMVFRIAGGQLTDIYVISGASRDRFEPF